MMEKIYGTEEKTVNPFIATHSDGVTTVSWLVDGMSFFFMEEEVYNDFREAYLLGDPSRFVLRLKIVGLIPPYISVKRS